jgi:ribosomal-protein-alanine N-acetyltransferase
LHLKGKRLRLRPIEENDLEFLFRWYNDSEALGEYEDFHPVDWFAFEKREKERSGKPDPSTVFMIERNKDRGRIGVVIYYSAHWYQQDLEIGYDITEPKERGKGYATEATGLLIDYLFLNKEVERIQASCDTRNMASQRVLEKCGFKKEGLMRKVRFALGGYRDNYLYSILREEWHNPKGSKQ